MIRYFKRDLKLSIKTKMDQDATHLNNYKKLIAKIVKAEVKVGLQPSFYIWETNQ